MELFGHVTALNLSGAARSCALGTNTTRVRLKFIVMPLTLVNDPNIIRSQRSLD